MPVVLERRKYLADALNEFLPCLAKAYAKEGKGKAVTIVLQQLIVAHADEETLTRIVDDIKAEIDAVTRVTVDSPIVMS